MSRPIPKIEHPALGNLIPAHPSRPAGYVLKPRKYLKFQKLREIPKTPCKSSAHPRSQHFTRNYSQLSTPLRESAHKLSPVLVYAQPPHRQTHSVYKKKHCHRSIPIARKPFIIKTSLHVIDF